MNYKLLELSTEKLLEKFGAGSHKPGSGSAAALQGMLSAKLIITVIELTTDEKRRKSYGPVFSQLKSMSSEITKTIFPRLAELFQQDSEQFDLAIQLRRERDKARAQKFKQWKEADQQSKDALKSAIETPIEIADLCVKLADFAEILFKNGFQSARGDSAVALNDAVATVGGCLCIINLNLLSIDDIEWIEKIKIDVDKLKFQYERVLSLPYNCHQILENEAKISQSLQREVKDLQESTLAKPKLLNSDIEEVARRVQLLLLKYQDTIWKENKPTAPIAFLKPDIAIEKLLNYRIIRKPSLDSYDMLGEPIEVAGVIYNKEKVVGISKKFSSTIKNFTLAHELGHAFLHKQTGLHRDRAMDGSNVSIQRDAIELQADKFASYFLMPQKQIVRSFQDLFSMNRFLINEDSVFALNGGSLSAFKLKCRNLRDLSRAIASAESFYGTPFQSMAEIFNVSIEAMAIRLEELDLIEYEPAILASFSF